MGKYGSGVGTLLEGSGVECLWYASRWWRDLMLIHEFGSSNQFNSEVARHVGIGGRTIPWNDKWRGSSTLLVQFSRLL
jgi:hypothetical protein